MSDAEFVHAMAAAGCAAAFVAREDIWPQFDEWIKAHGEDNPITRETMARACIELRDTAMQIETAFALGKIKQFIDSEIE